MQYKYFDQRTRANLILTIGNSELERLSQSAKDHSFLTMIWNRGQKEIVEVDGQDINLEEHQILCLMSSQHFVVPKNGNLVIWQFNRDFYCIVDHDQEVSCAGLLFYGDTLPIISIPSIEQRKFSLLLQVFYD